MVKLRYMEALARLDKKKTKSFILLELSCLCGLVCVILRHDYLIKAQRKIEPGNLKQWPQKRTS